MTRSRLLLPAVLAVITACVEPSAPVDPDTQVEDTSSYRVPGFFPVAELPPPTPVTDSLTIRLGADTLVSASVRVMQAYHVRPSQVGPGSPVAGPMHLELNASVRDTTRALLRDVHLDFATCPVVLRLHRAADRSDAPAWRSDAARSLLACPDVARHPPGAHVSLIWRVPDVLGDSLGAGRYYFSYSVRLADRRRFEFNAGGGYLTADTTPPTRDLSALSMSASGAITGEAPRNLNTVVKLVNTGAKSLRFEHGACAVDVRLYRTAARTGTPIWRSEHRRAPGFEYGYACPLPLYLRTLAPGDSALFELIVPMYEVVGDSLPAGRYFVSAELELLNDDKPLSEWSTTYKLSAGEIDIVRTPDRLPTVRTLGGLTYSASTRVISGAGGNDTVRTTARITNSGSQRATADVIRDCPVAVYAYRSVERRDSVPFVKPTIVATRSCFVISHRFVVDPGQTYSFSQDMMANDIRGSAGPGTYYFTAQIGFERPAFLSAGEAVVR